jgi:hypothetical protein
MCGRSRRSRRLGRFSSKQGSDPSPANAGQLGRNSVHHFRATEKAFCRLGKHVACALCRAQGRLAPITIGDHHRRRSVRRWQKSRYGASVVRNEATDRFYTVSIILRVREAHRSIGVDARLRGNQRLPIGDLRLRAPETVHRAVAPILEAHGTWTSP